MKRTRVRQYVERLTGWHYADGAWIRQQPFICFSQEIDIEELKRRYPDLPQYDIRTPPMPPGAIGQKLCIYAPLEVEVDPAEEVKKPSKAEIEEFTDQYSDFLRSLPKMSVKSLVSRIRRDTEAFFNKKAPRQDGCADG